MTIFGRNMSKNKWIRQAVTIAEAKAAMWTNRMSVSRSRRLAAAPGRKRRARSRRYSDTRIRKKMIMGGVTYLAKECVACGTGGRSGAYSTISGGGLVVTAQ